MTNTSNDRPPGYSGPPAHKKLKGQIADLRSRQKSKLPAAIETDVEIGIQHFNEQSTVYHNTTTHQYNRARDLANRDIPQAQAKARKKAPPPQGSSSWKGYLRETADRCDAAATAAAAVAGQREDAMAHPGRFIREEGHFDDRGWNNHQTQADAWKRSAAGWKAKADQARKAADSCQD